MDEIVIVTAFFDIGREKYKSFSRLNDEYFEYFDFWARINNDIIVYCSANDEERVLEIRQKYGKRDKTKIVAIDNIYEIESSIYYDMLNVEKNENFLDFRYYRDACSNQARYNYVMFLKYWFLKNASEINGYEKKYAWLDFGYNHGGQKLTNPNDFDFTWYYNYNSKINLFALSNPDELSGIDMLQFQKDCIIGHTVIVPGDKCEMLYMYVKEALETLIGLGCMDDDQMLLYMAYKRHTNDFSITICDWFCDFIVGTNVNFAIKEAVSEISAGSNREGFTEKINSLLFRKWNSKHKDFIARSLQRGIKYYGK